MGARAIDLRGQARWFRLRRPMSADVYPIAVEASGTTRGLDYALSALAPGGVCTAVAFYVRKRTPVPLWKMYMRSATLLVGVAHPRANLPALLELISTGDFEPGRVTALVGDWSDADRILLEPATKVIVRRAPLYTTVA